MNKLELKHLAPYLPHGLIINQHREDLDKNYQSEMVALFSDKIKVISEKFPFSEEIGYYEAKPILRPLSDLTKEIEHDGKKFVPLGVLQLHDNVKIDCDGVVTDGRDEYGLKWLAYESMQFLLNWHFDVFGLIEKGLAIDINTLDNE